MTTRNTTKAIAACTLGLTLGLGTVACGSDDNSNTSSRGGQKIDLPKEYDLSKRNGSVDLSPYSVALDAEKVADIPGLSSTRGLQIIDGKLFGHTLVNKDNGSSKVFSTGLDGSNYETVKELGPVSESPDAKFMPKDEKMGFNPETFGLSIVQENEDAEPALFALRGGALKTNDEKMNLNRSGGEIVTLGNSSLIKQAQEKYENNLRRNQEGLFKDKSEQMYSYQWTGYTNSCVHTPKLKNGVSAPILNTDENGELKYSDITNDRIIPNSPKGTIGQWIDHGSTSRYKKKNNLQKATSCAFSDNYLATNIRQHVAFDLSNETLNEIVKNGAENAKIALSLQEKEDEDRRFISHMISINGLPNNDADVTAVAVDQSNPNNLYFSIEGSDGLYKLDLSPIKDDSTNYDQFFGRMESKLPDDLNKDLK